LTISRLINQSPRIAIRGLFVCTVLLAAACGPSQFELLSPAATPSIITPTQSLDFRADPLEYHLLADDHRLIMEIHNESKDWIALTGGSVVDPAGNSHPILSNVIAPDGVIKEIFPPPTDDQGGQSDVPNLPPTVGPVDKPGYVPPPGYNPADSQEPDQSAINWQWNGPGDVRITLFFERDGKDFPQQFVFRGIGH